MRVGSFAHRPHELRMLLSDQRRLFGLTGARDQALDVVPPVEVADTDSRLDCGIDSPNLQDLPAGD